MRYIHTKCGGEIDVKKRQCTRCKKVWNPISFRLDPYGIRPMLDRKGRVMPDRVKPKQQVKSYADWGEVFVNKLPHWPRWARILTTVVFVAIAIVIILYVRRVI